MKYYPDLYVEYRGRMQGRVVPVSGEWSATTHSDRRRRRFATLDDAITWLIEYDPMNGVAPPPARVDTDDLTHIVEADGGGVMCGRDWDACGDHIVYAAYKELDIDVGGICLACDSAHVDAEFVRIVRGEAQR